MASRTATAPVATRTSPSSRSPLSAQPSPTSSIAAPAAPHGGAVGDYLAHGGPQLAAVEPHADHRIGAHQGRVLHHPIERLAPGVLEKFGVFPDLATDQRSQAGRDIAAQPP